MLLAAHAAEIVAPSIAPLASQAVIELGAGAGGRTLALLRAALPLADATAYVPVDVSAAALARARRRRAPRSPALRGRRASRARRPLRGEAAGGGARRRRPAPLLFLGSSLGNYDDAEIGAIFRLVRACMRDGGGSGDRFVIGVDTPHSPRKPARVIHAAYNDAAGATAAFTLNALAHVNRVAGVDFDWEGGWRHVAEYDAALRAIVTHVEAVGPQEVRTTADGALLRRWADGDRIFVEQSRKFDTPTIARLATAAGPALGRTWAADADAYLLLELVPAPPPRRADDPPAVATAEAADAVPSVRQRDEAFVGLAAARGGEVPAEGADLYGTLLEAVACTATVVARRSAQRHATLLAVAPAGVLPRQPGLNPVEWTLGHVAFTFESIVGDVLRRRRVEPRPSAAAEAWELYDSMRVTNGERWEMEAAAELPDARPYLAAVHSLCEEEAMRAAAGDGDGTVDPVVTYLVCYALIHELWHTEDLVHTRHCTPSPSRRRPRRRRVRRRRAAAAALGGRRCRAVRRRRGRARRGRPWRHVPARRPATTEASSTLGSCSTATSGSTRCTSGRSESRRTASRSRSMRSSSPPAATRSASCGAARGAAGSRRAAAPMAHRGRGCATRARRVAAAVRRRSRGGGCGGSRRRCLWSRWRGGPSAT